MSTAINDLVGQVLSGGRYRVEEKLGEGGMGAVYRAHDERLGTNVVIKIPHASLLAEPDFAARFAREVRALVKLSHPNIVKILDVDEHHGMPYAVMQYLAGGNLERFRRRTLEGRFAPCDPRTSFAWLRDVGRALDFIHERGYVHRDVKPANILFDQFDHVYLADFGIAKAISSTVTTGPNRQITEKGVVVGTAQYMAPELIMGEEIDGRVDQYALGVTVFEIVCGRRPFSGKTPMAVLMSITEKEPPRVEEFAPGMPRSLCDAIGRALCRRPAERFESCRAFAKAIEAAVEDCPDEAHVPTSTRVPQTQLNTPATTVDAAPTSRFDSQGATKPSAEPRKDRPVKGDDEITKVELKKEDFLHAADEQSEKESPARPAGERTVVMPRGDHSPNPPAATPPRPATRPEAATEDSAPGSEAAPARSVPPPRRPAQSNPPSVPTPRPARGAARPSRRSGRRRWIATTVLVLMILLGGIGGAGGYFLTMVSYQPLTPLAQADAPPAVTDGPGPGDPKNDSPQTDDQPGKAKTPKNDTTPGTGKPDDSEPSSAEKHFARGEQLFHDRKYDEAILAYGDALHADPQMAKALAGRARCYIYKVKPSLAVVDADKALQIDPNNAMALAMRGRSKAYNGLHDEALADVNRAIDLTGDLAEVYLARAYIYRLQNKLTQAAADCNKAVELAPKYVNAYIDRGYTYRRDGQYDKALADYSRAIELAPGYAEAYVNRGDIRTLQGDREKAIEDFTLAIGADSQSKLAYAKRGDAYRMLDKLDLALADLDKALAIDQRYAFALGTRGDTYRLLHRYQDALADLKLAVELDKDYHFAWASKGTTHYALGDYKQALSDLNQAIKYNSEYVWAYERRGWANYMLEEYQAAADDFSQSIRRRTDPAYPYYCRGYVYRYGLDNHSLAMADFSAAIRLLDDYAAARCERGDLYRLLGRGDEALADLNAAIAAQKDYARAYAFRGRVHLLMKNDIPQALSDFNEALRLESKNAIALVYRGEAYRRQGDLDKALADCDAAVGVANRYADAYVVRAQVFLDKKNYQAAIADADAVLGFKGVSSSLQARAREIRDAAKKAASGGKDPPIDFDDPLMK